MTHRPQIVVFDFDGVLIAHDSTGDRVRRWLLAKPWRTLAALPVALAMPLGRLSPAFHRACSSYLIRLALLESDPETIDEEVRGFGRVLAHRPGWPMCDGIDAARAHLDTRDHVLVASASLEQCVRAYLDEVGLADAVVLGSQLEGGSGSPRPAVHNYHAETVRRAERIGWLPPWDQVYSDSVRDWPMFAVSRHVTLVNVNSRTHARIARRADAEVDRVRWR